MSGSFFQELGAAPVSAAYVVQPGAAVVPAGQPVVVLVQVAGILLIFFLDAFCKIFVANAVL